MSKLRIWLKEKDVYCDVNEDTTCHETVQHSIKPPQVLKEERQSIEDLNATEYKLDNELFVEPAIVRCSSVCNSNIRKDMNWQTQRQTLSLCYETRLHELSEWIELVDSAIDVYDNTDVEDGLSKDEITENQITRLGLLLKKQSAKLGKLLKKQQEESLFQAKALQERLIKELEDDYGKMNYLDSQVNLLNSRLALQKKALSLGLSKELEERLLEHSCSVMFRNSGQGITDSLFSSPKLLRKSFRSEIEYPKERSEGDQLDSNNHLQVSSYTVDKWQVTQHGDTRILNSLPHNEVANEKGLLCMNSDVLSSTEVDISNRKDRLTLTFGLEDEETSVFV